MSTRQPTPSNYRRSGYTDARNDGYRSEIERYTKLPGSGDVVKEKYNSWTRSWHPVSVDPLEALLNKFEPTITRKVVEQQTPANPGIRLVSVSTYGITVPVSIGRRVVTGNIVDAEPITPRLEGAYEYEVAERVPVYDNGGPS